MRKNTADTQFLFEAFVSKRGALDVNGELWRGKVVGRLNAADFSTSTRTFERIFFEKLAFELAA